MAILFAKDESWGFENVHSAQVTAICMGLHNQLGTRPLSGRGVFVINGVSWMMFDVVVPIGFWLM